MTTQNDVITLFNFIENKSPQSLPIEFSSEHNNYISIINKFLNYEIDALNNYIIYSKEKTNYPKIDFVIIDIIDYINHTIKDNYKYKLFCILFWLYIHKYDQINNLVNDFKKHI
jgi:hypothetical protein